MTATAPPFPGRVARQGLVLNAMADTLVLDRLDGPATQEALAPAASLTPRRVRDLIAGLKARGLVSARRGAGGARYQVHAYKLPTR